MQTPLTLELILQSNRIFPRKNKKKKYDKRVYIWPIDDIFTEHAK